jgi:hypothetical protein
LKKKKQHSETPTRKSENTDEDNNIIQEEKETETFESLSESDEEIIAKQIKRNIINTQLDYQLDPEEAEEQNGDQVEKSITKEIIKNRRGRPKKSKEIKKAPIIKIK